MARKTKDSKSIETKENTTAKKVSKKSSSSTKTTKKAAQKKASPKKAKSTISVSAKKTINKAKSITKKAVSTKKTTTKSKATKKLTSEKKFKSEYYDLPYFYNKTVVKILAQTPKMLFIYWEISEADQKNFKKQYGDNFFENTRPVLIVFNDTLHYSFEVAINDFANSWYLHINDANCLYHVELGRRPIIFNNYENNSNEDSKPPVYIPYYVYLTSSNEMSAPNNKILFDPSRRTIRFRNVKTGLVTDKDIHQFTFVTNYGIFKIQDLYKYLYPNENFEYENIVLGNTSSGALSSSGMFSSQFK